MKKIKIEKYKRLAKGLMSYYMGNKPGTVPRGTTIECLPLGLTCNQCSGTDDVQTYDNEHAYSDDVDDTIDLCCYCHAERMNMV